MHRRMEQNTDTDSQTHANTLSCVSPVAKLAQVHHAHRAATWHRRLQQVKRETVELLNEWHIRLLHSNLLQALPTSSLPWKVRNFSRGIKFRTVRSSREVCLLDINMNNYVKALHRGTETPDMKYGNSCMPAWPSRFPPSPICKKGRREMEQLLIKGGGRQLHPKCYCRITAEFQKQSPSTSNNWGPRISFKQYSKMHSKFHIPQDRSKKQTNANS